MDEEEETKEIRGRRVAKNLRAKLEEIWPSKRSKGLGERKREGQEEGKRVEKRKKHKEIMFKRQGQEGGLKC